MLLLLLFSVQKWRQIDEYFLKPLFGGLPRTKDELDVAQRKLEEELATARALMTESEAHMKREQEALRLMEQ
eukprot:SAG31_NODE_40814_length_279_cov_0.572222_1_plen_71_part_01